MPTNSIDNCNAEVTYLLSTVWIDTYTRVFLATVGPKTSDHPNWSQDLSVPDLSYADKRDVRKEMEEAIEDIPEIEPDFMRIHPDDFKTPMEDMERIYDNKSYDVEAMDKMDSYRISIEEDVDTVLEKMKDVIDRYDLSWFPGAGRIPLDRSGEVYW